MSVGSVGSVLTPVFRLMTVPPMLSENSSTTVNLQPGEGGEGSGGWLG